MSTPRARSKATVRAFRSVLPSSLFAKHVQSSPVRYQAYRPSTSRIEGRLARSHPCRHRTHKLCRRPKIVGNRPRYQGKSVHLCQHYRVACCRSRCRSCDHQVDTRIALTNLSLPFPSFRVSLPEPPKSRSLPSPPQKLVIVLSVLRRRRLRRLDRLVLRSEGRLSSRFASRRLGKDHVTLAGKKGYTGYWRKRFDGCANAELVAIFFFAEPPPSVNTSWHVL